MQKSLFRLAGVVVVSVALSACVQQGGYGYNTGLAPDVQRAAGGALAGAVVAKAVDGNVATGALIGGAAGALCDDAGVCVQ